ncbi:MAG: HAMP domain-containing sensor histidine kinase [Campylobacterota bacterium]|nr:HAMP domain-containing sensor histidine kinase [Campylobacterota bacterium]
MKKFEIEALVKSFLLFFFSLEILLGIIFTLDYDREIDSLDNRLFNEMKLCNYDLKCVQFDFDFLDKTSQDTYRLYKDESGLYSFYDIAKTENYLMKLFYPQEEYQLQVNEIKKNLIFIYLAVSVALAILALFFSFLSLHPLRSALLLTEEFIKDILHDFNTPIASMLINMKMIKKRNSDPSIDKKMTRIEQNITTILSLQDNLKSYIVNHELQSDSIELSKLLKDRVDAMQKIYLDIHYELDIGLMNISANEDALIRIFDNLLSNAGKYNKRHGFVHVGAIGNTVVIQDSGKGIKNPDKIFQRFYKEQQRGIGIGLHIVKKLCGEMKIKIEVTSEVGKGTTFKLDMSSLVTH